MKDGGEGFPWGPRPHPGHDIFRNTTIVLVNPLYPGNVGSTARAMKNMGFSSLGLVAPRCELDREARWLAVDSGDILDRALIAPTLAGMTRDIPLVIGTTSRPGRRYQDNLTPREMAKLLVDTWSNDAMALVFGPEDNGLSVEVLNRCDWVVTIPSVEPKRSVNLSHAVIVICYEILTAFARAAHEEGRADAQSRESLLSHVERTLTRIGFLVPENPRRLMLKLRRIVMQVDLSERETRSIHAILEHLDRMVGHTRRENGSATR